MSRALATLLIIAALLFPRIAAGQSPSTALSDFRNANTALVSALIEAKRRGDPPPGLSDPVAGPLIQAALDERALPLVDWGDLAGALDFCATPPVLLEAYLLDGLRADDFSGPVRQTDPIRSNRILENARRYHDELALVMAFGVSCTARTGDAAEMFWEGLPKSQRTPVRLAGIRQMRDGAAHTYVGALRSVAEPQYSAENKALILGALVRNAEAFAAVLSPDLRMAVIAEIDGIILAVSVAAGGELGSIRDAFAKAPCTGLCAV